MNQPRLRFKEFKGEFSNTKIKNIANIVGGGTPSTSNQDYWGGDINWYSPNEIGDNPFSYTSNKKITELGLKKSSAKLHPIDTVLFTSRAGIGKMTIIKQPATTNQGFQSLELKKGTDPYFVYSMKKQLKHKAILLSSGSTFLEISKKSMENIKISVPNYPEQQKIGQFFQNLDQQIELQSDKLEHLKQSKQGYLQKMFPNRGEGNPQLRFSLFNDKYNSMTLSDIVKIRTGNKNVEDNNPNGKYVFFDRSNEIKHLDTYDFDGITIVYPGEGAKFLPRYFNGKYSLHQRAYGLYDFKNVSPFYLYSFLKRTSNLFVRFSVGTTAKSLRKDTFSHINVPIPSLPEQHLIGQFFSHLDRLIDLQQQKVDHLKRQKQAYLQRMFV